ncbi:hybrid sensor histidine kinase/response regulator transcription factor [Flavobacterium sp. CF136]|uniref:hybrid sensor histidine kinase/response regulator transcription factor n=1 Tax=Flavobacterium sp. (strain CF136) TaxID=1144313 RepID=UPI0002718DC7|nr:hybrid sensor histidine kinase/response regulator transcription factor [Flavobacterium sp. CF136]EJL65813.1 signal transduction histidine kinase [Flavobacterium sp. CF136]
MKKLLLLKFLIALLLITSKNELKAQIKCKIENYSTEDGLSHDAIRDIIKGKEGFMWFATWDGINRFDGKNFITYKATAGDNSSLGNNRIDLIKEDSSGYIWLKAYDNQIYRFDKKTESFLSVANILGTNKIEFKDIFTAGDGNVWLTTNDKGIYLVQKKGNDQIKIIHFEEGSKNNFSIASNDLNFVSIDKNNTVWVGSDKGLDMIIKSKSQDYKSKNIVKESKVESFFIQDGIAWFGTNEGELLCYNKKHKNYWKAVISKKSINSIIKSKNENLLFITSSTGELITFNIKTLKAESILKISDSPVYKIYQDKQGLLWVEPDNNGVFMINPKGKSIQLFLQKKDASLLQTKNSFGIFEDNFDRVWVKLKGGGFGYYNPKNNTLEYFFNEPGDENQKFSNIISSLYFDRSGILWISSNDGGINKIILQKNIFQQQLLVPDAKNKYENEIRALFTDKTNRLWIASKAGKLKVYQDNQELKNLFLNYKTEDIGLIYTITGDAKGNIWLGTKGKGLYKATPVNVQKSQYILKQFKADKNDPESISSDLIYSVLEDKKGRIWIGTYDNGINLLEENHDKFSFIHNFKNYPVTESGKVRYLTEGYKGQIWVATTNGLVTFNPDNYNPNELKFSRYVKVSSDKSSLGSNDVLFMYKDSEDKMWISTAGGGLNLAIETKDNRLRFKNFTKENGLPSDFILSMIEDDEKNLWLATENGISKFNLLNRIFRNYDSYDGLLKTRFSESSNSKLQNGTLIFGCKNGYLTFNPKKVENQKNTTKMVFTNFEINNKISNVKSAEFPLKLDINYNNNIQLYYRENTISIYYTVLDYRSNNKQLYAYRLKGLDDTWHHVKNQKKATFTNLPPGNYQFEVKCLNTELYINTPQKSLSFTIAPPFWKTNWAYFLYAIIILILLETSRRIAYSMIRLRNKVVVEQKMTELKLSFFTNISHELRTPLTLIVNPIEEIARNEKLSPLGIDYIETVRKNTNRLVRFVNQLLDFRKVQSGNEELNIEPVELVSFINEINTLFTQAAYEKNIKIKTLSNSETLNVTLDKEKMDIIIYNLLSNAIKFSSNDSLITVEVKMENDTFLKINVSDQGTGVDENKLEDIFKLYYETDTGKSKNVGTGIGLALCKEYVQLHQGTIYAANNDRGGLTVSIEIDLSNKIFQNKVDKVNLAEEKLQHIVNKQNKEDRVLQNNDDTNLPVVLIVEDNNELRAFLKSQLQRFYRILEAENGKEGLVIATSKLPDLILSDIMMPQMDGIELLDALKNATETSHIPVILLTAKSSVENKIEGLNYGADYYITKPFDTNFLMASIENLIRQRKKIFERLQTNVKTIALEPGEIVITTKDEQFLKDIIAIVENSLIDPKFNIDVIANSLNMSRVTFNRKFKSLTNMTPVEFVRDVRIKKAKQFLDAGETDIADIAYKVGFNGAGYFSTCFKESCKISPSDYLKQKQDNLKDEL